jgi:NADPH:quinone reductase-like Zn-dependent oxidoreductase
MEMNAAVVRSFERAPRYERFDTPEPHGKHEALMDVLAAGLHPRVRSGAAGAHYTSTGRLPMIPGIDGVARSSDGTLRYFLADDGMLGSMAESTVVDLRRSVPLPAGADAVQLAAAMNPAMSSWVALRRRVPLQAGQSVLVLGVTGNAGQMAVQVAAHLGAGRIVGAGRNLERLDAATAMGAHDVVQLTDDPDETVSALAMAAADVDLVIDYLWGAPAATAMMALLKARADRSRELNWIQIGAVAGPAIELPSVALRSANLRLQGNGQGAVSTAAYLAELPSLIDAIDAGTIGLRGKAVPLADVEATWHRKDAPGERTVLVP